MGQSHAAQVEIVGFLIVRPCAGLQESASRTQHRQQSLADLFSHLLLHANQVLRGSGEIGLPYQPFRPRLNRFQGDQQMVSLLLEMSGQNCCHMQILADLLRINVGVDVFSGDRRGTNIQGARIGEHISDFVGEREAKIINVESPFRFCNGSTAIVFLPASP